MSNKRNKKHDKSKNRTKKNETAFPLPMMGSLDTVPGYWVKINNYANKESDDLRTVMIATLPLGGSCGCDYVHRKGDMK